MMTPRQSIQRVQGSSALDAECSLLETRRYPTSRRRGGDKAALVTLCLPHLPFHPSCFLGYGAAVLAEKYDLEVIDLNAELHFINRVELKPILDGMDETRLVSDALFLHPFYAELETHIDELYEAVAREQYPVVYVTPPSWFPMVPTEDVLRLTQVVKRLSPETRLFFFGNSLGSWTDEGELKKNGVQTVHLNDIWAMGATPKPVLYDLLPDPIYEHRDKYLFDLCPFMLKHGCSWGRCRFCSLSKGWNSGCVERSAETVIKELEALIDQYDPAMLVCRDHSLNGHNLVEFCGYFERFRKPWCGASRPDLSGNQIQALRKSGCRLIYFGLESGSDRTLNAMNKGITSRQLSEFVRTLHSNEIMPAPSLIIGYPGEEMADFEKTIQFFADHRRYFEVVNVYPFMATPGSEIGAHNEQSAGSGPMRLFRFIQQCEDLGLKVCLGEQCMEYVLFSWLDANRQRGS